MLKNYGWTKRSKNNVLQQVSVTKSDIIKFSRISLMNNSTCVINNIIDGKYYSSRSSFSNLSACVSVMLRKIYTCKIYLGNVR